MIFVTVGAQMPFDRLVAAVDRWARQFGRNDVFAQIGESNFHPSSVRYVKHLQPQAFRQKVAEADLIVAHAGMGSILTALEVGRPILVMPRRGDLRETRNDHQVATANKLAAFGRVNVAMDEEKLVEKLEQLSDIQAVQRIGPHASAELLRTLREFIVGPNWMADLSGREHVGLTVSEIEIIPQAPDAPIFARS